MKPRDQVLPSAPACWVRPGQLRLVISRVKGRNGNGASQRGPAQARIRGVRLRRNCAPSRPCSMTTSFGHAGGSNQLTGDYRGFQEVMGFFGKVMELSGRHLPWRDPRRRGQRHARRRPGDLPWRAGRNKRRRSGRPTSGIWQTVRSRNTGHSLRTRLPLTSSSADLCAHGSELVTARRGWSTWSRSSRGRGRSTVSFSLSLHLVHARPQRRMFAPSPARPSATRHARRADAPRTWPPRIAVPDRRTLLAWNCDTAGQIRTRNYQPGE